MDTRVWVGPAENAPSGWTVMDSLEAFLISPPGPGPTQIVIDDRAATLRESDFQRVYAHSPLARISRFVGPWRAGIGRTDPAWPFATTRFRAPSNVSSLTEETGWLPLTSGYEELTAAGETADLTGLSVSVRIRDSELRGMWIDTLGHMGAELLTDGAEVLIHDGSDLAELEEPSPASSALRVMVHLCVDPWNTKNNDHRESCRLPERSFAERQASVGSTPIHTEIVASILDSPAAVIHRVARALERGPL